MSTIVWYVSPSGCVPGEGWRPHRVCSLTPELNRRGMEILWWTPAFCHELKSYRCQQSERREVQDGFKVQFLRCGSYYKHISLSRMVYLLRFAYSFFLMGSRESMRPNAIVVVTPALGAELAGFLLSRIFCVPLIIDIIDPWPEFFFTFFPSRLKFVAKIMFAPLKWIRNWICRRAEGLVSCCQTYMEIPGIRRNEGEGQLQEVVYWGSGTEVRRDSTEASRTVNKLVGRSKEDGEKWVIYAGTLGNNYDLFTILGAARRLKGIAPGIRFIIAGRGPLEEGIRAEISKGELENFYFLGLVSSRDLWDLCAVCDLGLIPYIGETTVAMPIKFYDYISLGLPVLSSLGGELGELVADRGIGGGYQAGDEEGLAGSIKALMSDLNALGEMAERSSKLAIEFGPDKQYSRYAEVIKALAIDKAE